MLTQTPNSSAALPAEKSFWRRADEITGLVLFMLIVGGGVVAPFALYFYGLLFR